MAVGNKNFCPECEVEIIEASEAPKSEPQKPSTPAQTPAKEQSSGHSIKDGMGMIEENRTKIGAVETFSDNSVTNHTHTTNTTNISNITQIADDTKKSVVCEISGKKVLVTSSVVCPVCGKTVSEQYYDEGKLRCQLCEQKAVEAYERFYSEMVSGTRVIDSELRSVLDEKAKSLKLSPVQIKEIEIKLRKAASDKQDRLSDIQQKDLNRTLNMLMTDKIDVVACLNKVSVYAKLTDDAQVQCWFRLLSAIAAPDNYLQDMKNASVDDYWQTYWSFLAAMKAKKTTEAVICIDSAKKKYPEKINDITLALAYLEVMQYVTSQDESYLQDARNDYACVTETESPCLQEFAGRLGTLLDDVSALPKDFNKLILSKANASKPAATKPAATKPAPTKPSAPAAGSTNTTETKGYTLNTAGGPLNPTMTSFPQAQAVETKQKKKGGIWLALILGVMVVGGYLYYTKVMNVNQETAAQEATASAAPAEKAKQAAPTEKISTAATATTAAPAATPASTAPAAQPAGTPAATATPAATTTPAAAPAASAPATPAAPKSTLADKAVVSQADIASLTPEQAVTEGKAAYAKGNYKLAFNLFKKAASANNSEACYQIGMMLSTGKGEIAKNVLQAKVWLKKAAGAGHSDAAKALETL